MISPDHRDDEVEHLRERIKMLEAENTDLKLRSAFMKQRLDELEAELRANDPTCADPEPVSTDAVPNESK